jgi:hypothetical protein
LCPSESDDPQPIDGIAEQERELDYWLEQLGAKYDLDEVLLSDAQIDALNRATELSRDGAAPLNNDLLAEFDEQFMRGELATRLDWMRDKLESGDYVLEGGERAPEELLETFEMPEEIAWEPKLRVLTEEAMLYCGPVRQELFTKPIDPAYSRNNCSRLEFGEPVQVLADFGELLLVRSRFAFGWIDSETSMTSELSGEAAKAFVQGDTVTLRESMRVSVGGEREVNVPQWTELPLISTGDGGRDYQVLVPATGAEPERSPLPASSAQSVDVPFTRENVLRSAFEFMNAPYGWGGQGGGLDCSRFLLELFEDFGLDLPRFSGNQPLASSFVLDVSQVEDTEQKRLLIDAAAEKGVVLLRMDGHIMLYLGRNEDGEQRALHSFAEYLVPCDNGERNRDGDPHTLVNVGRVDVSGLELGAGTERTSFIERISEVAVLGKPRSYELMGMAEPRPAANVTIPEDDACDDSEHSAIFTSPRFAHAEGTMRIVHVATKDPGPGSLVAVSPEGERRVLDVERRGAPPFTTLAELESPEPGIWKIVYGDGDITHACDRVQVRGRPIPNRGMGEGPTWEVRNQWSPQFENLYAAWVEKLFSYPLDEDITWSNLQSVLKVEEKNFLHDYYAAGEDEELRLQPDCADLPYMLRAYFAWKLGLPFGYRRCSRGREGRPPMCGAIESNLQEREYNGIGDAFEYFARRGLMNSVHSGSGRTVPDNEETDYYPVPLTRAAVRPGVTYIDPDGHLLVVAGWIPQTLDEPGVMYAADAQPDGTIGRRRFWRGSFLFRPETESVGAGFKAFRPLVYDRESESLIPVSNSQLARSERYIPFSREQNEGSRDDFYEKVESMENPLPVKPETIQLALVEAFDESVSRRVNSVKNCEEYMEENGYRTVEMPHGYNIFETSGAWENYSTPARDMRLLISLDTVLGFIDSVRRRPERFGIRPENVEERVAAIEEYRDEQLASRTFEYERSDGSMFTLSLKDITDRRKQFEMSYNPNDCPEIRWAAPEGSEEISTCDRYAPDAQRQRMREYRTWFENRRRPAR